MGVSMISPEGLDIRPLMPANCFIEDIHAYVHVTFDGGGTTELTVQIGDADPNGLVTAKSIHEDGTGAVGFQQFTRGVEAAGTLTAKFETGMALVALFTSTTADLDALTVGDMTIILKLVPFEVPAAS